MSSSSKRLKLSDTSGSSGGGLDAKGEKEKGNFNSCVQCSDWCQVDASKVSKAVNNDPLRKFWLNLKKEQREAMLKVRTMCPEPGWSFPPCILYLYQFRHPARYLHIMGLGKDDYNVYLSNRCGPVMGRSERDPQILHSTTLRDARTIDFRIRGTTTHD